MGSAEKGMPVLSSDVPTPASATPAAAATGSGQQPPRVAAVVLAGGSGSRVGADRNKVFLPLAGRPVLAWSLDAMRAVPGLIRLVLVIRAGDEALLAELHLLAPDLSVVPGGTSRTGSEIAALRHLAPAVRAGEIDVIAIHDGARPLPSPRLVTEVTQTAYERGGAVPGLVLGDRPRLVEVDPTGVLTTVLSGRHATMQTPQAFAALRLLEAYDAAAADGYDATDTAACVEHYTDLPVYLVAGEEANVKVTVVADLARAERLLRDR